VFLRWVCFQTTVLFWTAAMSALAAGLWACLFHLDGGGPRNEAAFRFLAIGSAAACVLFGALFSLDGLLHLKSARCRIGAAELVLTSGGFMRTTKRFRLADITRIDVQSGPLTRLFGLADVHVYADSRQVAIAGLPNAEEARRFLEERRDALREGLLAGDIAPHEPRDMAIERLSRAIERLEKRVS